MSPQRPEDFVERFAEAVRAERERLGLSQKKLAETAGVARTGVVTLEQGKRVPTLFVAKALATALADLVARAEEKGRAAKARRKPAAKEGS